MSTFLRIRVLNIPLHTGKTMKKQKTSKKSFEQKLQSAAYRYSIEVRHNKRDKVRKDKETEQYATFQEELENE